MSILLVLLSISLYLLYRFKKDEEYERRIFRLEAKLFDKEFTDENGEPPPEVQKWINDVVRLECEVEDLEKELQNVRAEMQGMERNSGAECNNGPECPVCVAISSVPGEK